MTSLLLLAALAYGDETFELALKSRNESWPETCRIHSDAMKLVYACAPLQSPGSNPYFHGTVAAGDPDSPAKSTNGVNYCFNTLVYTQRTGANLKIMAVFDRDPNNSRHFTYEYAGVDANPAIHLTDLWGKCFTENPANKDLCKKNSLLGGEKSVPLVLDVDRNNKDRQSRKLGEKDIEGAKQLMAKANVDQDAENKLALEFADKQLFATVKNLMPTFGTKGPALQRNSHVPSTWDLCDRMAQALRTKMKVKPAVAPEVAEAIKKGRDFVDTQIKNPAGTVRTAN